MKNLFAKSLVFAGLVLTASMLFGQTLLLNTTLSNAVQGMGSVYGATPTGNMAMITVASATGISAPAPNTSYTSGLQATSDAQTYLYIDRELMQVKAVSGTNITVIRGLGSTSAVSHISGALVFVIPTAAIGIWNGGGDINQNPSVPQGSCTRTSELYLPRIQFATGLFSDCLGGQWVQGDASQTTRQSNHYIPQPYFGANNEGAAFGTSTATTAAELYCTEIDLPYSHLITGIAPHIGATGGTDKWIVALYDSSGNLIANSAVAGATVSGTAYAWQAEALTAPYYAVGPAQYYGCVMSNGTTATLDLIKTNYMDLEYTYKSASAGTFGTLPNFTAPTQFTTVNGPWLYLY
jgi:hypothetical protein